MLEILHYDEHLIAINKPKGMLVHRSPLARQEKIFAMQTLRDQVGHHVFPLHRIDRPTSGVLLFGTNKESATALQKSFEDKKVTKKYLALVRGFIDDVITINHPINNEYDETLRDAISQVKPLYQTEVNICTNPNFPTSRYTLAEAEPITGRTHQLRKHFAHIRHYIIGDKKHGDNKQNKAFMKHYNMNDLLLHSYHTIIPHPFNQEEKISIKAPLPKHFSEILQKINIPTNQL
ncbi:pseudouridine synthase [Aureibacter tunicatorum]|uniref:tRNA pseudouridine synthase C n=1 Tax=Aureibacter tunicatorum TaxID=866807 RepID=A0AAE3XPQ3_9BACT|nr:pseudouridine synthase [Aureibacter tunicatorum]MDR6239843.1 tRNA pseudouridine65 synthase [Aureibacter tunicatorum]